MLHMGCEYVMGETNGLSLLGEHDSGTEDIIGKNRSIRPEILELSQSAMPFDRTLPRDAGICLYHLF